LPLIASGEKDGGYTEISNALFGSLKREKSTVIDKKNYGMVND